MTEFKTGDRVKVEYEGVVTGARVGLNGFHYISLLRDGDGRPDTVRAKYATVIEPAYEHGQFYVDARNEVFRYSTQNGDRPWRTVSELPFASHRFDYPQRPLRKLVPEEMNLTGVERRDLGIEA